MVNVRDEVSARARARCLEEPWQTEAVVSSLFGLLADSECGVHRSPGADQTKQSINHISPLITLEHVQ